MKKISILLELIYAYLLGAPVKDRQGRTWHRPTFGKAVSKVLDWSLWGVDFSKWQGVINFVKVKAAGIRFLILRCSYGITPDERFIENITAAIGVFIGWLFGVYHYYDPRYSPQSQASKLLSVIGPYRKYIRRVWIDLEFTWAGGYEASKYWKEFGEIILAAGYDIGFYTRATWWDSRVGALSSWFAQFPLWAAQYSSKLTLIPKGWGRADIWQNGIGITADKFEAGTLGSKEYDHDISDDTFYVSEFGGTPPPTNGGSMNGTAKEALGKTSTIRTSPGVVAGNSTNFTVGPGQTIEFVELVQGTNNAADKWFKLPDGNYVQYIYAGKTYYNILTMPSTTPPPPPITSDKVASIFKSEEIVVTYADGTKDTFRINNVEFTKVV